MTWGVWNNDNYSENLAWAEQHFSERGYGGCCIALAMEASDILTQEPQKDDFIPCCQTTKNEVGRWNSFVGGILFDGTRWRHVSFAPSSVARRFDFLETLKVCRSLPRALAWGRKQWRNELHWNAKKTTQAPAAIPAKKKTRKRSIQIQSRRQNERAILRALYDMNIIAPEDLK